MTLSISILLVFYPYSADDVYGYLTAQCPTGNWLGEGGGSGSGSGSNDNDNGGYDDDGSNYDYSYLSAPRYGKVKDYGYSCDRCVCYTDGTGCDCDDQDEWRALMNVASYGPATVCLDASAWQDYGGGIMTSDSGCSAQFLDMNHCVQAVGYAFTDGSDDGGGGRRGLGRRGAERKRERAKWQRGRRTEAGLLDHTEPVVVQLGHERVHLPRHGGEHVRRVERHDPGVCLKGEAEPDSCRFSILCLLRQKVEGDIGPGFPVVNS